MSRITVATVWLREQFDGQRGPGAWVVVPAAVVIVVAFAVLLLTLGAKTVWFDEAYSANLAATSYLEIAVVGATFEINMTPYYLLLRAWTSVFGDAPFALRFPSAVAMVSVVALTFVLARKLHGDAVAWIAAAGVAVHAATFQYGQEARGYALATALLCVASLLLVSDRRRAMDLHGIVMALACYTHVLVVLVVVGHLLYAATMRGVREAAQSAVMTALCLVPFVLAVLNGNQYTLIPPLTVGQAASVIEVVLGGGGWWVVAIAVLALVGAVQVWDGRGRLHVLTALSLLGGGMVLSIVRPVLIPRYFVVVVPSVVILATVGAMALWRRQRAVGVVLAGLSVIALTVGLWEYARWDKEDWIEVVELVKDDSVTLTPIWSREAFRYHARQQGFAANVVEDGEWTVASHGERLPVCDQTWQFQGVAVGRDCAPLPAEESAAPPG